MLHLHARMHRALTQVLSPSHMSMQVYIHAFPHAPTWTSVCCGPTYTPKLHFHSSILEEMHAQATYHPEEGSENPWAWSWRSPFLGKSLGGEGREISMNSLARPASSAARPCALCVCHLCLLPRPSDERLSSLARRSLSSSLLHPPNRALLSPRSLTSGLVRSGRLG